MRPETKLGHKPQLERAREIARASVPKARLTHTHSLTHTEREISKTGNDQNAVKLKLTSQSVAPEKPIVGQHICAFSYFHAENYVQHFLKAGQELMKQPLATCSKSFTKWRQLIS